MKQVSMYVALLIAGCASTGPVSIGQDTYMISKQSSTGFHSAGSVKADIYAEGSAFCRSQGKEFQPVNERGQDGVPGRSFANAEVQFRCLSTGDSDLGRPTLEPFADVKIEAETRQVTVDAPQESDDVYVELKKLKELLDAEIITQEEFDERKRRVLAK